MPSIASLRLIDFRSYIAVDIKFDSGTVALFGANGAGKTNLLEAISLLSPGRGLRRANTGLLARVEDGVPQPAWGINANFLPAEDTEISRISVGQIPENPRRKQIKIDGRAASGPELARHISMLWLTPAQDRLFTGPASDRRKFLDRFALAFRSDHGSNVIRFERARTERNRLLSEGMGDRTWFNAVESDLSHYGVLVAQARAQTVSDLQTEIASRKTIFPQSLIRLDGYLENQLTDGSAVEDVTLAYKTFLSETRQTDLRAGRTLCGPHRTEFHVTHLAKAMPAAVCSTGEQKALLIGLVLAQARALRLKFPILLLDEVAAHLDSTRRAALAEELLDLKLQVFMTGTDQGLFIDFGERAQNLKVVDSQVSEIKTPRSA